MSAFIYDDTDYLLPHDDRLEGRKIAYVVQVGDNFAKEDGGALQLLEGKKVVKSISPSYNAFTIFKVSSKSWHQVQEVLSSKKRVSFAGWFHG
jgi:Rps23 Pro-64 3,4-dihydroxylase Tpa1-like proline 4-hydroxylase